MAAGSGAWGLKSAESTAESTVDLGLGEHLGDSKCGRTPNKVVPRIQDQIVKT